MTRIRRARHNSRKAVRSMSTRESASKRTDQKGAETFRSSNHNRARHHSSIRKRKPDKPDNEVSYPLTKSNDFGERLQVHAKRTRSKMRTRKRQYLTVPVRKRIPCALLRSAKSRNKSRGKRGMSSGTTRDIGKCISGGEYHYNHNSFPSLLFCSTSHLRYQTPSTSAISCASHPSTLSSPQPAPKAAPP
jgi:hypothetical protein